MRTWILPLSLAMACADPGGGEDDAVPLRPSLTQLRTGEVAVDDPPVIPEERFIPGIVVNTEDVVYPGEEGKVAGPLPPPPPHLDLSAMEDREDPVPLENHRDEGTYAYATADGAMSAGPDGDDGLRFDDVEQGAIGDCYLAAALSSALYADEGGDLTAGLIREVRDEEGRFRYAAVRFHDAWGEPQDVLVDAELLRKRDRPVYLRSLDSDGQGEELGLSLVEKAYALWHGDYEKIGNGGWAGDVMQALTGGTATYRSLSRMRDETVLSSIQEAVEDGRPVVAGTFGEDAGVDYSGTRVYAWHAYSVLGARQDDEGTVFIELRNPWGSVEPAGNGPDDGIFELDLATFRRLYEGVTWGGAARPDVTAPDGIDDLAVVEVVGDRALLSLTAPGDDRDEGLAHAYDVRVASSAFSADAFFEQPAVEVLATPQAPGGSDQITIVDPALATGGTVYVAVRAVDEAGNLGPVSDVVTVTGRTPEEAVQAARLFDFESARDGWDTEGLCHFTESWAISPTWGVWCGDEAAGDYGVGDPPSGSLVSPPIDLVDATEAYLLWEHILDVEAGSDRDLATVTVSTQAGGYADGEVVWTKSDVGEDVQLADADLSPYLGEVVQLRFAFDAVDGQANGGLGWVIDNVWVFAE